MPPPVRAAAPVGPPEFHVQAGAFKSREYADDLIRHLRANGYTATMADGPLIRVWVGPPMSRSAAERLAANLRANGFETTLSPAR
jgi:cell division septation protein DedD